MKTYNSVASFPHKTCMFFLKFLSDFVSWRYECFCCSFHYFFGFLYFFVFFEHFILFVYNLFSSLCFFRSLPYFLFLFTWCPPPPPTFLSPPPPPPPITSTPSSPSPRDIVKLVEVSNDGGPLGIHVVPFSGRDRR